MLSPCEMKKLMGTKARVLGPLSLCFFFIFGESQCD